MVDKRKDIPTPNSANFAARTREELMRFLGRQGDRLDRAVTLRDLTDAGMIVLKPGWQNGTGIDPPIIGPGPGPGSSAPPPTPTGLTLTGAISHIIIEHDDPKFTNGGGYARTLVYGIPVADGAPLPTFADAELLCDFQGAVFAYPSNPSRNWRIWIKWQSRSGSTSAPAGGTNGAQVETGRDVRELLDAVTEAALDPAAPYSKFAVRAGLFYVASDTGPTDEPVFAVVTSPIVVGGVLVPVGVYMASAFIMNGTITNAKIADLAVDNAKIANLSASKITAGTIAVGQYIQSTGFISGASGAGWRIDGVGNIEASNAIIRGAVFASSGAIGGIVIDTHAIRSSNFNAGTGVGFRLADDGTLNLPNGSITAGSISVSSLSAITATLGDVNAGSIRGGAFTGYGWPATGGGFYLGPGGLLLGNFNTGQWFQAEANGNISMPGLNVSGGVLYFQQANAIDTNNIVIGAVTVGSTADGTDDATIYINVPAGQTWNLLLVISWAQSNAQLAAVGGSAAQDCTRQSSVIIDGGTPDYMPIQNTTTALSPTLGQYYFFSAISYFKSLNLGPGSHSIRAQSTYDTWPFYDTPVNVVGYSFKR